MTLSFAQERLWLLNHLDPADTAYHLPLAATLRGPLRPVVIAQAFAEIARRHAILRTRYPVRRGVPEPAVDRTVQAPPLVDLSGLPAVAGAAIRRRLATAEARRPFDLGVGPVQRCTIVRAGPAEHDLLVTRHHVASDGWSLAVLGDELGALYPAYAAGRPAGLAEPPMQFADFARAQRRAADGVALGPRAQVWADRIAAAPATLAFVPDRRPATAAVPVRTLRRNLDADLGRAVAALARQAGTTPYAVLLAGLGVVLAASAGQRQVVLGSPVAGRPEPRLERLIGCFATVVPLVVDTGERPTFAELVRRVHRTVLEALGNADIPLERLLAGVRPERTVFGGSPLFSVAFAYQNTPEPRLALSGIAVEVADPVPVAPKFPLTVTVSTVRTTGHGAAGQQVPAQQLLAQQLLAEYDDRLLHADTVSGLVQRYVRLLELAVARPDAACGDLMRAATVPGPRLPTGAARPPVPPPDTAADRRTLATLLTASAAERPDAIAVSHGGHQVSYRELARRARALSGRVAALGIGSERLVGLCVEPSIELVTATCAAALAGAGYVPLEPTDPPARQEATIRDAGDAALLVSARLADRFAWYGGPILPVDGPDEGDVAHPGRRAVPDQVAYVIYTSGSTGTPKGVVVSHRNVLAMFDGTAAVLDLGPDDVWTLAHSSAFDFSVWELWGALRCGGRLVVLGPDAMRDPVQLWRTMTAEQVTVFSATPSAFRALQPAAVDTGAGRTALRYVVFGGERCDPVTLAPWLEAYGDRQPRLVNLYGITETTVHATHRRLRAADAEQDESPIGAPLPGVTVRVIDRDGVPVLAGGQGELCVGGTGVARGYLRRPGLTADRFRPDEAPAAGATGRRRYGSGDLVRLRPDGELSYLGRIDQQVKLRGHRIEPAEIEAALAAHPDVAAAAVTLRTDAERSYLVGYVVPRPGVRPSASRLRRHLAERLPAYLVPARYAVLDQLPLTRNGKLDYAALPSPDRGAELTDRPPRTPTQRKLAALWCELLGLDAVGVDDNFFELGGDSLLVTRLHARLPGTFGVDLPMRQVYQALDVASLAEAIDQLRTESEPASEDAL